jgi:hypothetical protein
MNSLRSEDDSLVDFLRAHAPVDSGPPHWLEERVVARAQMKTKTVRLLVVSAVAASLLAYVGLRPKVGLEPKSDELRVFVEKSWDDMFLDEMDMEMQQALAMAGE